MLVWPFARVIFPAYHLSTSPWPRPTGLLLAFKIHLKCNILRKLPRTISAVSQTSIYCSPMLRWQRIHLQCRRPQFDSWVRRIPWRRNGLPHQYSWASPVAQPVKDLPAVRETWVRSLAWEDPLEKGKASHSSILAWRIARTVSSLGSRRAGHEWATSTSVSLRAEHSVGRSAWSQLQFSPLSNKDCSVLLWVAQSDSVRLLRPHRLWPARLLRPRRSPGKSTAVGCHCLLQSVTKTSIK